MTAEAAAKVYEKPSSFMKRQFGAVPKTQVLVLSKEQHKQLKSILKHRFKEKQVRYWKGAGKTAWILNETGKSEFITTGVVVKGGKIHEIKVLVYRESHGWEVSKSFFTQQFKGAQLDGRKLDRRIDGIVGATLSVNAMKKVGAAALYLSSQVEK
ncbi:FMN-binding protein [Rubritalea marina]|uniref:FMN-binding protein n=1 Tax=Rubritalea marina TaxID=361055 RepID=UPI0003759394|nr:FMN-binding protein [Rubritalea marina]